MCRSHQWFFSIDDASWEVSTPGAPVPAPTTLHTLPFGFNPGDARDMGLIGRVVRITPPLAGSFCMPVGAVFVLK